MLPEVNQRFGGTTRLHLQGSRILLVILFYSDFVLGLFFDPDDGVDMFFNGLHGVISQKTELCIQVLVCRVEVCTLTTDFLVQHSGKELHVVFVVDDQINRIPRYEGVGKFTHSAVIPSVFTMLFL
jgi:hypothetical protein